MAILHHNYLCMKHINNQVSLLVRIMRYLHLCKTKYLSYCKALVTELFCLSMWLWKIYDDNDAFMITRLVWHFGCGRLLKIRKTLKKRNLKLNNKMYRNNKNCVSAFVKNKKYWMSCVKFALIFVWRKTTLWNLLNIIIHVWIFMLLHYYIISF